MKSIKLLFTLLFVVVALNGFSQGVAGTAHDMSGAGWNDDVETGGEICVVCHTPHNAASIADAPLWNNSVSASTFIPYSNAATLDATVGQPGSISMLCLGCHDGTAFMDAYGGQTGSVTMGVAATGLDISGEHPIGFDYTDGLAGTDGGLHAPSTTLSGLGLQIDDDMLFSNSLECASCHDVHNDANQANLLIKSNAASALCLTCHDK